MLRLASCLSQHHNPVVVICAALVCVLGSFGAFTLIARAHDARNNQRMHRLIAAAASIGAGAWATHFIAMLAYRGVIPIGFAQGMTLASAVVALISAGVTIALALAPETRVRIFAGPAFALGVTLMHFCGMAAIEAPVHLSYDLEPILVGMALGMIFASGAMHVMFVYRASHVSQRIWLPAVLLSLAIFSIHFLAMSGMTLVPDPSVLFADKPGSIGVIAGEVIAVALGLVGVLFVYVGRDAQRLHGLVNASLEGILIVRNGRLIEANNNILDMLGRTRGDIGIFVNDLAPEIAAINDGDFAQTGQVEVNIARHNGEFTPVRIVKRRVAIRSNEVAYIFRDLTDDHAMLAKMTHIANHDALTSLPNRALFNDRLEQAIARATRDGSNVGLVYLDLDGFKSINDLHGHAAGDRVLQTVSNILSAQVRASDTVARIGGDEFAIIQNGIDGPEQTRSLATRLLAAFEATFTSDTGDTPVGVSLGIALYPNDGREIEVLQRNADAALYRSKKSGKGTFRFFTRDMDLSMHETRIFERDLRASIAANQLHIHYQPQADAETGAITGFEALLRWQHPVRGNVPPDAFIPVAEDCGFIMSIGKWVLREACAEAASWPTPLRVAVNMSPIQFQHSDVAVLVEQVLNETGLAPDRLEIEITETALMRDRDATLLALMRLRQLGVRIAMDDFGTGYSSLSNLQSFPFDKIKIDRSFVLSLAKDPAATTIVRAIIGLGKGLRLPITAEGVETDEQLQFLRAEECTEIQGYFIGRPQPIGNFTAITHQQTDLVPA